MITDDDRLITIAIHTFGYANSVKTILENEGIDVVLQNVNLENPAISAGVRVRIHESNLPAALRILENPDSVKNHPSSYSPTILLPTDFSPHSLKALFIAFEIAVHHKCGVTILHSFFDPKYPSGLQLTKSLNFSNPNLAERHQLERKAWLEMKEFTDMIDSLIAKGELPKIKYKTILREGVPEENVLQLAKELNPLMIVMGTRDSDLKERETMGSVTAEVLDNCRYPVFAVTETTESITHKNNIVILCTLDQSDIIAVDSLMKLIDNDSRSIHLIGIPSRKASDSQSSDLLETLRSYCSESYPSSSFGAKLIPLSQADTDFRQFIADNDIRVIVVPNRRKNAFARLFNPGLAHRLLFQSSLPLIAIPV